MDITHESDERRSGQDSDAGYAQERGLKDTVLEHLDEIWHRFVVNTNAWIP